MNHQKKTVGGKMMRLLDILISMIILTLTSPVLLGLTFLGFLVYGAPFFYQQRAGLYGNAFNIIKFKTMADKTNLEGALLSDADRLNAYGKFLRKYSLDELPQLINVLAGTMSLVGPRPLHVRYVGRYSTMHKQRLYVKPGITGWAQVNGRNALSWHEKFDLDVWYVENKNIWLDLKIIFKTFFKVLGSRDISSDIHATMKEYKGSNGE
ncbi:MAG: sugar transferase [Coxiellaceae bacterium]|nr:sugar transferase [Coxiellaceae bacterium]